VVRTSIAEFFVFGATCGVNPSRRASATNPFRVGGPVGGDRASTGQLRQAGEHFHGGGSFGVAVGNGQLGVDDQRRAMLHQQVPGVAEHGGGVVALARQAGLVVRRRGVRVVAALLAVPGDLGVAPRRWLRGRTVFGLEALPRRPRLQQRRVRQPVRRPQVSRIEAFDIAQLDEALARYEDLTSD
jgi:hypothetical protein